MGVGVGFWQKLFRKKRDFISSGLNQIVTLSDNSQKPLLEALVMAGRYQEVSRQLDVLKEENVALREELSVIKHSSSSQKPVYVLSAVEESVLTYVKRAPLRKKGAAQKLCSTKSVLVGSVPSAYRVLGLLKKEGFVVLKKGFYHNYQEKKGL